MTGEPKAPKTHQARRRWRPSSLVAVVLLAGLTAAVGPHCRSAYLANREIHRLWVEADRLGGWAGVPEGQVDFWNDRVDVSVDLSRAPVDDEQLARLVGTPAFRHVTSLILANTRVTDRSLELLVNFPRIGLLDLSRTNISDQGMKSVAGMKSLVILNISNTGVSDAGIEILVARASSINLRSVFMQDTRVSREAADKLRQVLFQPTILYGPSAK